MPNLSILKKVIAQDSPELLPYLEQTETNKLLRALMENKQTSKFDVEDIIKIIKEAKKEVALTPEVIDRIVEQATPIKGQHYFDGKDGRNGQDGQPGSEGPAGQDGKNGKPGKNGRDGSPGRDGIEITPQQIASHLNTTRESIGAHVIKGLPTFDGFLKEIKKKKLNLKDLEGVPRNMPIDMNDLRWHGGGLTGSAFVYNEIVNGSGTTFTLLSVPVSGTQQIYVEGQRLTPGTGNDYTINGSVITTALSWSAGTMLADYRTQ